MTNAISIITEEHRSLAAVLKGLLAHVSEAQAGRSMPDFYLAAAMLDYIQAFPERLHHPKEDEYLFRFLRSRCAEAGPILDTLEAQHTKGAEMLADLRNRLDQSRAAGNFSAFAPALDAYAEFHWDHMRKEEEIVFPLAERHLRKEDWQAIDTAFRSNLDRTW